MRPLLLVAFLIPLAGLSGRQDEKKEPAPNVFAIGKDLPGQLNPYNVTGTSQHRFHDTIGPHGLDPAVLILTGDVEISDDLKKLLQALDNAIEKNPTVRLETCAVFYSADIANVVVDDDARDALAAKLDALAKDLTLKHVVLAIDSPDNAGKYKELLGGTHALLIRKLRLQGLYGGDKWTPAMTTKLLADLAEKVGAKRK